MTLSLATLSKRMDRYNKYEIENDIHWQWYNNLPMYHTLVNDALDYFNGLTGSVVDIGCGDGLPLSFLAKQGMKCYGVDNSMRGIELAMEHGVKAEFFVEKAEKFAQRKLEFDYLLSINTIEHLDDPQAMVDIMENIKEFGIIITDDASSHSKVDRFHNVEFTRDTFQELFKDFNLAEIYIRDKDYFGYKLTKK